MPHRSSGCAPTTFSTTATARAEYFQAYTQALESGLFFEIVERRGYAGFGAANAPIRLAAQSRLAQTTSY